MSKSKKLGLGALNGMVFSTDPDAMPKEEFIEEDTPENKEQKLRVVLDKKQRAGKVVTLVEGFIGREEDFQALAKKIKTRCGTGGTAKDGVILIQGDYKLKIAAWLQEWGYSRTKSV